MTKRRPTVSRRPERMTYGDSMLERGPDDYHWLMMRDWMARTDQRFERMEERFSRMEERFSHVDRQIAAVVASVKELAVTVGGIDRRLCEVEGKVDDLVAWKHRIWGVVIAVGALYGAIAYIGSLLARHVVG